MYRLLPCSTRTPEPERNDAVELRLSDNGCILHVLSGVERTTCTRIRKLIVLCFQQQLLEAWYISNIPEASPEHPIQIAELVQPRKTSDKGDATSKPLQGGEPRQCEDELLWSPRVYPFMYLRLNRVS